MNSVVHGCRLYSSSLQSPFRSYTGISPSQHLTHRNGYVSGAGPSSVPASGELDSGACFQRSPSFAIQELLGLHPPGTPQSLSAHHHHHHQYRHQSHQLFRGSNDDRAPSSFYCGYHSVPSTASSSCCSPNPSSVVGQVHSTVVDHDQRGGLIGMGLASAYDVASVAHWRSASHHHHHPGHGGIISSTKHGDGVMFGPGTSTSGGRGGGSGRGGSGGGGTELRAVAAEAAAVQAAVAAVTASNSDRQPSAIHQFHHRHLRYNGGGFLPHLNSK